MFIIYKITSKSTGKSYIGVTNQSLKKRWYQHCWQAKHNPKSHFHKAIAKYGCDDFITDHWVVEEDDSKRVMLEQHFISEYCTHINGYNSTEGGEDFTSSDYQRDLQKRRVAEGTHPFLGGSIQRESTKRRWANGEFNGNNKRRVEAGTHHFLGDSNPQRRLAIAGKHHNQTNPWNNTKATPESLRAWAMADKLHVWYKNNASKKRGGSYKSMAEAFNITCSLQVMYYKYFKRGWNPLNDSSWVDKFHS